MKKSNGKEYRLSVWGRIKRRVRFSYLRIVRLRTSAHSIALGAALGVFVGCLPIIPFQSVLVILLAILFRANKVAAFLCTFFTNVFTMIPFYALFFLVGGLFLKMFGYDPGSKGRGFWELLEYFKTVFNPETLSMSVLLGQGWYFFVIMLLGGFLLGVPCAVISYFLSRQAVLAYRRRKAVKHLRKHME